MQRDLDSKWLIRGSSGANRPLDFEPDVNSAWGGDSPSHGRRIVREAKAAIGTKKNDAAMTSKPVVEVSNGFSGCDFRNGA